MSPTFVLTNAESRLHADVMMIRLRRAEISGGKVSAIFSPRFAPNSVFLWLGQPFSLPSEKEHTDFFVSGPLQKNLRRTDTAENLPAKFRQLGFDRYATEHFGQALLRGQALLCVRAESKAEVSIAWHIFRHSGAEMIAVSGSPLTRETSRNVEVPVGTIWSPAFAA